MRHSPASTPATSSALVVINSASLHITNTTSARGSGNDEDNDRVVFGCGNGRQSHDFALRQAEGCRAAAKNWHDAANLNAYPGRSLRPSKFQIRRRELISARGVNTNMAKRELINTGTDKRFVRRGKKGTFKESDDVSKSLAADRRTKATATAKWGQGDKGDRKVASKKNK